MDFRKLQTTSGGSSYIVSLPKEWVAAQKLRKGQSLAVNEREDGALVIMPGSRLEKPKTVNIIEREGDSVEYVLRKVVGHYMKGAYDIEIRGKMKWEEEKELGEWVRWLLLGATLSREGDDRLAITVAIDETEVPPQKLLKRAYNIADWMYREAVGQLGKKNSLLSRDIKNRDSEVDRLRIVCCRGLNKAMIDADFGAVVGLDRGDIPSYLRVIDSVENVGDFCCDLAEFAEILAEHEANEAYLKKFGSLSLELGETYELAMNAFFMKDSGMSNTAIERCVGLKKELHNAMIVVAPAQHSKEAAAAASDSFHTLLRITGIIKHIAELNVNRCV